MRMLLIDKARKKVRKCRARCPLFNFQKLNQPANGRLGVVLLTLPSRQALSEGMQICLLHTEVVKIPTVRKKLRICLAAASDRIRGSS